MTPELHPLGFFLPENTRLLMLGSFPPPRARWSMNFYYPNIQNDMWRILGFLFYHDKNYFLETPKAFSEAKAKTFSHQTISCKSSRRLIRKKFCHKSRRAKPLS